MNGERRLVREPILIVGSPRSGTTLLGELLARHPDVAYWEEPRPIWSQGNAWRDDDRLTAADLTPSIARRIDHRFADCLAKSGRTRFAEKTPSNTLRLPFLRALYPDARLVHLVRDSRAVVHSMFRMLEKTPDGGRVLARLRETPWRDLPALVPIAVRDVIGPRISGNRRKPWWGPRPPGWRDWLELPAPVMLARQWRSLVSVARDELRAEFPESQWIEFRYEDFVADPETGLRRFGETTGLAIDDAFLAGALPTIRDDRVDAWKADLDRETVAAIEGETSDLLRELGYLSTSP